MGKAYRSSSFESLEKRGKAIKQSWAWVDFSHRVEGQKTINQNASGGARSREEQ
jgi:hypothetical protein